MKLSRCLLLILFSLPASFVVADWTHQRGPSFDGRVDAPGTFDGEAFGLEVAWHAPIGSSYSGIVVADGKAVTMFADGDADRVAAFDVASGREVWRQRLGDLTHGQNGSDDGPLSSPVIGDGRVYALSPAGRLVALGLENGEVAWERKLVEGFDSVRPDFGFTTTPVFDGSRLIVQVGGPEGRQIAALDASNGKTLWTHGDSKVNYQSPAIMTLAGRRHIVAVAKGTLTGLAADTGELLWKHELGEQERVGASSPTFVGDDRFLVKVSGDAAVFRIARVDGALAVEELYRTNVLGGDSYAAPVYHEGHVYGFRGQVLSCMDASTGERVWRSRPPGGAGLILVDGHLVVFGAKGNVVVVEATPDGYNERARVQALSGSSLVWPSFDAGRIYVRNLERIAAVSVVRGRKTAVATDATSGDHAFGRWVQSVEAGDARIQMVDEFFEKHDRLPLIDGDYVHFVFRSDAAEVAVSGSMNDTGGPEPMRRIEGTDLHHRTYRLEPGSRWEYRFNVGFDEWSTDPYNPATVPAVDGDEHLSEVVTAGYRRATFVEKPDIPRGHLEELTLTSEVLGYDKQVRVWLPPGYEDTEDRYPLLIVNDGKAWLDKGLMAHTLDNLVGTKIRPLVVVFIEAHGQWWTEGGGSRTGDYVRMQVTELIPTLEKRYRLKSSSDSRAVMGNRFFAVTTAYAALEHPDVFGHAAMQSAFIGLGAEHAVLDKLRERAGSSVRFYLDWNRYDDRNIDRGWDAAADSRELSGLLKSGGYHVEGGEVLDSYGWGGWRNRTDRILTALFPQENR